MPLGSPPRMRGKPTVLQGIGEVIGITPADAGKTRRSGRRSAKQGDHPRGCGENDEAIALLKVGKGSPPRMRGKPCAFPCSLRQGRITPADAGKTHPDKQRLNLIEDHPRGCGENYTP